ADGAAPERLGDLLERRSYACYLTGQFEEAIEAQNHALECHRRVGDRRKEGDSLRALSRLFRYVGRPADAAQAGRDAVTVLERLPPGHELAMAYSNVSHPYTSLEDAEETIAWADRAPALA